jgi:hypothetical protein
VLLRLRNFFKASEGKKTSLKINEVVEGIVTLVRHELERNHVLLRTDLSERLPTVQGDSVQLQQVGIEEEKLEAIFQPFILRKPTAWARAFRSAARLSRTTEASSSRSPTMAQELHFVSLSPNTT